MADRLKSILSWWPIVLFAIGSVSSSAVVGYLAYRNNAEIVDIRRNGTELSRAESKSQKTIHDEIDRRLAEFARSCEGMTQMKQEMAVLTQALKDLKEVLQRRP